MNEGTAPCREPSPLSDKPTVTVNGPDDPELAKLWALAHAKFEAAHGRPVSRRADLPVLNALYGDLMLKPTGPLSEVLARITAEVCPDAPPGGG
jgi:hypothetical protein